MCAAAQSEWLVVVCLFEVIIGGVIIIVHVIRGNPICLYLRQFHECPFRTVLPHLHCTIRFRGSFIQVSNPAQRAAARWVLSHPF